MRLDLAFEEMAQQPEQVLTMDRGKYCPHVECLLENGRGGTWLGVRWDIAHHLPFALKLGPAAGAQPR